MAVQAIPTPPRRLSILGDDEIDALYGRPRFTLDEREHYFALSPLEHEAVQDLRSVKSQAYFVLQLGYFKAKSLFFTFDLHDVQEDLDYIMTHYFPQKVLTAFSPIDKGTRLKQQRVILALCQYQSCDREHRHHLEAKAQQAAMVCAKPVYVFRELLHYLTEHRLVLPGYSFMQDTVGKALTSEQHRLTTLVRQHLAQADIAVLQRLLDDTPGLHEVTQLKREPKDFSAGEIKREIQRGAQIRDVYHRATTLLPVLHISNENIKHYASLVNYYSVYKLKRLDTWVVYLYLLCFVSHRYQRLHDNLLSSLIHHVRRYTDDAKEAAKDRVADYRLEGNANLPKAGQVLKLFTDDRIAAQTPFEDVQAQAFRILARPTLDVVADHIATNARFDETALQWAHIDTLAPQFKRHLRPILLAVDFAAASARHPLMDAVRFLKATWQKGRTLSQQPAEALPRRCIPDTVKRYLYVHETQEPRRLLFDRYEFLIYRLLRNGLEAGDIFCRDSVRFRSFEDDLLDDQRWQEKETLLANIGLPLLTQPIQEHLAALEQQLEDRLTAVNQRITAGDNTHVQITKRTPKVRWTLQYPRSPEPANHLLFDALTQVDISRVLHFVHQHCGFMDAFEHVLGRYVKQELDDRALTACLIAWGTNMGVGKMADISDLGYHTLASTSASFLRLETLRHANDRISNALAALPIFRQYDLGDALHSSSDGQKFETRLHTINARYSPKYFGLHKGVVAYSLVANHIPINATIIGANEHESHYVLDLLLNNTTDIRPEVHSTDTHGTNEVNFGLLHIFGYQFAPRYRDFYEKVQTSLYGFKHPSQYPEGLLKPIRKINPRLIVEEWEHIQRILVSLALKTTTQHIIVGKLSAYPRKNKTRRALWEYDNIIRSLYLLEYIDSPPLRQHVQRALNRGESYHQLRRAVSYANFGKLRFKTEEEQHLWEECSRLLTNCIIYYNAMIVSQLWTHKERLGDMQGAAQLAQVSPVAWQHINLCGRYEFTKRPETINMEAIIQELAEVQIAPDELALTP
jgi:TnpA family transposase